MQAIDILKGEHRVIEQVLNCLEKLADNCQAGGRLDEEAAWQVLDFLHTFADRCHHSKEENYLFPMLEAHGFRREYGPTGVMLREHEEGRLTVEALEGLVEPAAEGSPAACKEFARVAREYIALLRNHINKEDHCLFPMADSALDDDDRERLLLSFTVLEAGEMEDGTHERYLDLADSLADRLGVPRTRLETVEGRTCCHGHH